MKNTAPQIETAKEGLRTSTLSTESNSHPNQHFDAQDQIVLMKNKEPLDELEDANNE